MMPSNQVMEQCITLQWCSLHVTHVPNVKPEKDPNDCTGSKNAKTCIIMFILAGAMTFLFSCKVQL